MKSSSLLLLFACIWFFISCQNYRRPGTRGTIPVVNPNEYNAGQNGIFSFTEDDALPDLLPCDISFMLTMRMTEVQADCEGYDFSALYDEAIKQFDRRKAMMQCADPACQQLQTYIVEQSGVCPNQVAGVIVKFIVRCDKNETPAVPGLPFKSASELEQPFNNVMPAPPIQQDETFLVQQMVDSDSDNCPYTFKFRVTVLDRVESCESDRDYLSLITKAESMAKWIFQRTVCGGQCNKKKFQELGVQWDCKQNHVKVDYWFEVRCARTRRVS